MGSSSPLTPDRPGGHLCGDLDAECFELVHTALTACAEADPDNPRDTEAWAAARAAGWEMGDPIPAGLDTTGSTCTTVRSARQRLHDALALAAKALLDSGALGLRGKTAPHLGITIRLAALNGEPGALPAVGTSGQRLPLSLVKQWWADAYVTRYVLGLGRRVIETQPHRTDAQAPRTTDQAARDRRPLPRSRLHPRTRHPPRLQAHPPPRRRVGQARPDVPDRDGVAVREPPTPPCTAAATITLKDGRRLNADGWVG